MFDVSSLQSTIGSMALTGYPIIDNFILITILPILVSYCMTVFNVCKEFLIDIIAEGFHLVQRFLDRKLKGEVLVNYILDQNENKMFNVIKSVIFNERVNSDVNDQLEKFLHLTKPQSVKGEKYSFDYHYQRRKKLRLNYVDEDTMLEQTENMDLDVKESKMFKHDDYFLRFELSSAFYTGKGEDLSVYTPPRIDIKIISFNENYDDKKDYSKILEAFLEQRFKIKEQLHYTYHILVNDEEMNDKFRDLLRNNNSNRLSFLKFKDSKPSNFDSLYANNEDNDDQSSALNPNLNMSMRKKGDLNNLSKQSHTDLLHNLNIIDQGLGVKNDLTEITNRFLTKKQYDLFYANGSDGSTPTKNYFIYDNCIFLIRQSNYSTDLFIISIGTILTKEKLSEILYTWINSKVEQTTVKGKAKKKAKQILKRNPKNGQWASYVLDIRSFDTIYLPKKTINEISDAINNFKTIKTLYEIYQIPYKKGILFYGPPGTGKTSVVKALAYEFQMDIFIINVNDEDINDDTISDVINSIGSSTENRILLFEDIDTAFADKEKVKLEVKDAEASTSTSTTNLQEVLPNSRPDPSNLNLKKKFLTYSGLLNALDGVMSNQHGVITVMTTNYIERLGPAFLRPGRIDHKFELTYCIKEQIEDMVRSFIRKKLELDKKLIAENNANSDSNSDLGQGIQIDPSANIGTNTNGSNSSCSSSNYSSEDDDLEERIEKFCEAIIDPDTGYTYKKLKPCEIQGYLLKNIEHIDDIFANVQELNE